MNDIFDIKSAKALPLKEGEEVNSPSPMASYTIFPFYSLSGNVLFSSLSLVPMAITPLPFLLANYVVFIFLEYNSKWQIRFS